jgi:hypothetical protein
MTKVIRKRKKLVKNKGELAIAAQLTAANVKFSFEPHSYEVNIKSKYTPDFEILTKTGKKICLEIKGHHKGIASWFSKMTHFIQQHPEVDYRIIFLDANKKVNKSYKSNLGELCTKKGIKWAGEGVIPRAWLDE